MIRVAIIEDDPLVQERLGSIMAAADDIVVVGAATSARAGRQLVEAGGFEVLLCDLGLPDGNGIDLIRLTTRLHPDADIIVVTIFADQSKVLASIKAGAKGYLLKDQQLEECAEGIREIRRGGSPINPMIARQLLLQLRPAAIGENADDLELLSDRETDVLNMLARGFSYSEIAGLLGLSTATIGTYVKRVYRKLEVNSRAEAVFEAGTRGIINVH